MKTLHEEIAKYKEEFAHKAPEEVKKLWMRKPKN